MTRTQNILTGLFVLKSAVAVMAVLTFLDSGLSSFIGELAREIFQVWQIHLSDFAHSFEQAFKVFVGVHW